MIALREESGVVFRDVEVLAEENVVSKTGFSFLLLLMSCINCTALIRKSNFSSSEILPTAGITEMKNASSSSGAVLLLLKAFKISLSLSFCNRHFFFRIVCFFRRILRLFPHQTLLAFYLHYQVIVVNLPYLRKYRLFVQFSLKNEDFHGRYKYIFLEVACPNFFKNDFMKVSLKFCHFPLAS